MCSFMNENLDLTEVLKDCPKGTKLYSPIFGYVTFDGIADGSRIAVIDNGDCGGNTWYFAKNGKTYESIKSGEVMLFPSKEQRDWSKFVPFRKPKFKVGDRIIDTVRKNGYVYEVLEVLEDRYSVTCFDTLLFSDQDEFELAPVQIELVKPKGGLYWFVWKEGKTEPLLNKLEDMIVAPYRPVNLKDGDIVFNVCDKVLVRSATHDFAMLATMLGTELRIKE